MTALRSAVLLLVGASAIGGLVGMASVDAKPELVASASASMSEIAVATGIKRKREPQPGDRWGGCNDARAAGTAPIYRDEPGYREDMDGDGDGTACEPAP